MEVLFKHLFKNVKLDPKLVEDVCIGNVLQPAAGIYPARLSLAYGGFPYTTAVHTTNRFCASGLESVATIAGKIKAGYIDCGIGAGVENMSIYPMTGVADLNKVDQKCFSKKEYTKCLTTMGKTSENVAAKFGITR